MTITLVLGGARSGKSVRAEALTLETTGGGGAVYIATAQALDPEMTARVAAHQARRGPHWETIECPIDLAAAVAQHAGPGRAVLVDCLTLWLSNVMLAEHDVAAAQAALLGSLTAATGPVVLVANEVGLGIVPETPLGRRFRDAAGRLNQDVARIAARVEFVAAGLPMTLKGGETP